MKINHTAVAGTMESSDIQITLIPSAEEEIKIDLQSPVLKLFGRQIKSVILTVLEHYHITGVQVQAIDKGALDCVIKARTEAAVHRALDIENSDMPWEVE